MAVRLIWLTLAALHILPIWRIGVDLFSGGDALGSFIILLLAQGFFVLKGVDVRWLRMPYRHGTLVSLVVLAAIGHGDVAAKGIEQMPMLMPTASVLAVGAAAARVLRRRGVALVGRALASVWLGLLLNQLATRLQVRALHGGIRVAAVPCYGGRAPPLNVTGS